MISGIPLNSDNMSLSARFLVFRMPSLVYMAFIYYMSSGPVTSDTLNAVPDKVLHALGYSVLSILVFWAVHQGLDSSNGHGGYSLPILLTVLYGISDEYHQSFVPSRSSDVRDVMADVAGAYLGAGIIMLASHLLSSYREKQSS